MVSLTAKSLEIGNGQTEAAACIWSNATVPDANKNGLWDGGEAVARLASEHFVCRRNTDDGYADPGNNVVYCYGYNHTTNPGADAVTNMTPWTKIAAVFKLATLYPDTKAGSTDYSGGFIFSLISANANNDGIPCSGATDNCDNTAPCAGTSTGNLGTYLGWSRSSGSNDIYTPKLGVEVDFFPNTSGGSNRNDPDVSGAAACGANSYANHVAAVYYVNSGAAGTGSASTDNQHGNAAGTSGIVNPSYADESGGVATCSQVAAGINGFHTNATAWTSTGKQWLEDAGEHWVRVQVERNATTHVYDVYFWLDDSPDAKFLRVDLVNGAQMTHALSGADYYEHSQVTLSAADDAKFNSFRFGWTMGIGATGQTISISSFGMNATR